jgi:hypothetical protein
MRHPVNRTRSLPALVASAALLVGLTACGGDDGDSGTAEEGSEFCELAEDAERLGDRVDDLDFESATPDEIEEAVTEAVSAAEATLEEAPEDIADAMERTVEVQQAAAELLEDFDWDAAEAFTSDEALELVEDQEAAEDDRDDVRDYLEDRCDIEDDSDDTVPDDTATDDTVTDDTTADTATDDTGAGATTGDDPDVSVDAVDVDLPDGEEGIRRFVELYSLGSGTEVTEEQTACVVAELEGDVTVEELEAVMGGEDDMATQQAVGLAFLTCDIVTG